MSKFDLRDFNRPRHDDRADMAHFAPSMTKQEFADDCDINTLMARYEAGGAISHVNRQAPVYMDVTQVPDLRGHLDAMREASFAFMALPAKVRKEFDNDPERFVDFAQQPESLGKMREWGLAPEAVVVPEPPIMRVQVVDPAPVEPKKGG
jgi:phage internal scaffolding protein